MNFQDQDFPEIERFLLGEMNPEESRTFSEKMNHDSSFQKKVTEYKLLLSTLKNQQERTELKKRMQQWHGPAEAKTVKLRPNFTTISIAASIALVATVCTWFFAGYFYNNTSNDYYQLKKEVAGIQNENRDINERLDSVTIAPAVRAEEINAEGTAFAINNKGILLTNYHITEGARYVYLTNSKYGKLRGKVLYSDRRKDISLIQITDTSFTSFGKIPYGIRKKPLMLAEKMFLLGYPKDDIVYGEGNLSSLSGYHNDSLSCQISIPVNPGNSGSPLFDDKGLLTGMVIAKQGQSEATSYALQARTIESWWKTLPDSIREQSGELPTTIGNNLPRITQTQKIQDFVFKISPVK